MPLIQLKQLRKRFGDLTVINGVDLAIEEGEILGLAGESGCGKSTLGKLILKLFPCCSGEIFYQGKKIKNLKAYRREVQMIFQNPYSTLNPRMTAEQIIREPMEIHGVVDQDRVRELFQQVGFNETDLRKRPHQFSGGQRQRIAIARALSIRPKFIVCDEPISSLDVSVQAQIVNLLKSIQRERGLTYLFIGHDLTMMQHVCDRIAVMKEGSLVEVASTEELFRNPQHPYTKTLLSSIPKRRPYNKPRFLS